eukprot:c7510_g1_i2.p1 GENE.c7510_g1_i2~~c7510_g1_i2.p1  ORF type:complete len:113 (+),score=27.87 c7510_g1_i2:295-633(+)
MILELCAGDLLIVTMDEVNKQSELEHVLYKSQLHNLVARGLMPETFKASVIEIDKSKHQLPQDDGSVGDSSSDGDLDDIHTNTNRKPPTRKGNNSDDNDDDGDDSSSDGSSS